MEIELDLISFILIFCLLLVLIVHYLFFTKPASLTHPLLLGRQAEASPMRFAGESPVWINSASVGRYLVARPDYKIREVKDLFKDTKRREGALKLSKVLESALGLSKEGKKSVVVSSDDAEGESLYITDSKV